MHIIANSVPPSLSAPYMITCTRSLPQPCLRKSGVGTIEVVVRPLNIKLPDGMGFMLDNQVFRRYFGIDSRLVSTD
jgi:hypothetical protein